MKNVRDKFGAIKRAVKSTANAAVGVGQLGIGLAETFVRRATGDQGVSKIGASGIKRLNAVERSLKKSK